MENNKKSQAELYREERKERLAKAAAKKAKKTPKNVKAKKLATKIIAIVLAVVVGLGAIYGVLSFFDVPQSVVKVTVKSSDGQMTYKISAGEFNYYYFTTWVNFYQQAAQYEQYMGQGAGLAYTGFDYTKAPADQPFTAETATMLGVSLEEIGNPANPTWADAITFSAINNIISTKYGAEMARKNKIQLTEEEKTYIEGSIYDLESTANQQDYSLNRYLRTQYGSGVTEKVIRTAMEENYLSQAYFKSVNDGIVNGITEDDVLAEFEANKKDYTLVDLRMYTFKTTIDEAEHTDLTEEEHTAKHEEMFAETKAKADAFLEKVKDEESFIKAAESALKDEDEKTTKDPDATTLVEATTYAKLSANTEELAKWVFDDARQVGDKTVIDNGAGTCYVVMMKALPYQDDNFASVNVRHILIQFPEAEKGEDGKALPITDKQKADTKAEAQKILDDFLANEPTEDKFAALAKEKTQDPGSKENGGLYENVADDGTYVESFTKWSVDGERKAGDTGLVETEYGYHIMYFVKSNEGAKWHSDVKTSIANEKYTAQLEGIITVQTSNIEYDSFLFNWMEKNANKTINKILVSNR